MLELRRGDLPGERWGLCVPELPRRSLLPRPRFVGLCGVLPRNGAARLGGHRLHQLRGGRLFGVVGRLGRLLELRCWDLCGFGDGDVVRGVCPRDLPRADGGHGVCHLWGGDVLGDLRVGVLHLRRGQVPGEYRADGVSELPSRDGPVQLWADRVLYVRGGQVPSDDGPLRVLHVVCGREVRGNDGAQRVHDLLDRLLQGHDGVQLLHRVRHGPLPAVDGGVGLLGVHELRRRRLLRVGGLAVHRVLRGSFFGRGGRQRVPQLRHGDLLGVWGIGLHQLRRGLVPVKHGHDRVPKLWGRDLLGRRRQRLLELQLGDVSKLDGVHELLELPRGHILRGDRPRSVVRLR